MRRHPGVSRRGAVAAIVVVAAPLLPAGPAAAQDPDACLEAYRSLSGSIGEAGAPCRTLAAFLAFSAPAVRDAADRFLASRASNPAAVFGQRAFQARHPQHAALGGTPAQSDAVPSVRPAALSTGSVALVGSEAGDRALAALGINPAMLFFADYATDQLARLSRFMDLSVFVPVTAGDGAAATSGTLDYVGVRLRLNVHGLAAGDAVWEGADSLIRAWAADRASDAARVEALLTGAPSIAACAEALVEGDAGRIRSGCGRDFAFDIDAEATEALRDDLEAIRAAADAEYFGADVRIDFGDPTLGAVPGADATTLFAGLAWGRRLGARGDRGTWGVRARLGARHSSLADGSGSGLGVEGALGFELARAIEMQEVSAAIGLEGAWTGNDAVADRLRTNAALVRASLVVPLLGGSSVSMAVGAPIAGDLSSFLTVNFNWGLLLPETAP